MRANLSSDSTAIALGAKLIESALHNENVDVTLASSYGLHWLEPVLEFQHDSSVSTFRNVTSDSVESIVNAVRSHTAKNHPKFVDSITTDPFLFHQQRLVFDRAGLHAPLCVPHTARLETLLAMDPNQIIDEIEVSGLRGRGGAGFPAHIKWRTVADTEADQRYVVCNADEGDSGTFSDRMLMEADPFKLIEGMVVAAHATKSTHGFIYLRSEYPVALEVLNRAIELAYQHGILGQKILGSNTNFDLEVFVGAGAYICGEETSMLESLEGKRGQIRFKPPLPAIAGLFQKPTLVHNVITLASVPGIFLIGPEEYASLGVGASTGTMPFQISGNIQQTGLIEIPFGESIRTLVEDYGQGTLSGRPLRAVQIGGPLGAYLSDAELDTPLTYEDMESIGAGLGHGGLVVFDDSVNMLQQAEYAFEFCEIESCGKCTPCRIGSVRGKEAVKRLRNGADIRTFQVIDELCEVMEQASLCQMGSMTPIPVRSAMQRFPEDFRLGKA